MILSLSSRHRQLHRRMTLPTYVKNKPRPCSSRPRTAPNSRFRRVKTQELSKYQLRQPLQLSRAATCTASSFVLRLRSTSRLPSSTLCFGKCHLHNPGTRDSSSHLSLLTRPGGAESVAIKQMPPAASATLHRQQHPVEISPP